MDNREPNLDPTGCDGRLLADGERYETEFGVPSFDLRTLTARVRDRPAGIPATHRRQLEAAVAKRGPAVLRLLAIRLTQAMMEQADCAYPLTEKLIEAAEDALESGIAPDYYELVLSVDENRREVECAGLTGWMAQGDAMYAAPPLLAAAMLLHDDAWDMVRNVYDLADWLYDMMLLEDERECLYAPETAACIVERFLDELLIEL